MMMTIMMMIMMMMGMGAVFSSSAFLLSQWMLLCEWYVAVGPAL